MLCPGGCGKTLDMPRSNALVLLSTYPDPNYPRKELSTTPLCSWCARRIVIALERGTSLTPIVLRSPRPRFYLPPKEDMAVKNHYTCDWAAMGPGCTGAIDGPPDDNALPNGWAFVTFDDGASVTDLHLCSVHGAVLRALLARGGAGPMEREQRALEVADAALDLAQNGVCPCCCLSREDEHDADCPVDKYAAVALAAEGQAKGNPKP